LPKPLPDAVQRFADTVVTRICIDSREAQAGDLFFALAGERFDAITFWRMRGWVALSAAPKSAAIFRMRRHRWTNRAAWPAGRTLIATISSCRDSVVLQRKTTTKELIASVLRQKWRFSERSQF